VGVIGPVAAPSGFRAAAGTIGQNRRCLTALPLNFQVLDFSMTNVRSRPTAVLIRCVGPIAALICLTATADAQTTITINQPDAQVWSATVRGGSYANTNLSAILETRASNFTEYRRRALLQFDTQNTIPAGTWVTSATLTVTVKQASGDASRTLSVSQVTNSWEEPDVTWNNRQSGTAWVTAGGDYGTSIAEAEVASAVGTRVSFDVTPLVQQVVAGAPGSSRYTRVALLDNGSSTRRSWRSYYTGDEDDPALRPTLTVTYDGSVAPPPPPPPVGGQVLRVLHWNIAKNGWGSDGIYDPDRIVAWVVKLHPDIISFNEMEKWNQYSLGEDGVALYQAKLEAATGVPWYTWDIQNYGVWTDKGLRSTVFSTIPFITTYRTIYSAGKLKTGGGATIAFNGRTINFMTTHFDPYDSSYRATQAEDLVAYANGHAEDRIICGDFNDQPGNPPIATMTAAYRDAWVEAKTAGIAVSAPDNPNGNTRRSRIDYIFYSRQQQHLTLQRLQVVDTRDANGVTPSDHRPVLAEFLVQ
jgi:endonuclease/exonuclease/phosphatase family metal-dependent hydrolase